MAMGSYSSDILGKRLRCSVYLDLHLVQLSAPRPPAHSRSLLRQSPAKTANVQVIEQRAFSRRLPEPIPDPDARTLRLCD